MTGTVKDVRHEKGFGFIKCEDGADRFFHRTQVGDEEFARLAPGHRVEFEHQDHAKGARAVNVRRITQ